MKRHEKAPRAIRAGGASVSRFSMLLYVDSSDTHPSDDESDEDSRSERGKRDKTEDDVNIIRTRSR